MDALYRFSPIADKKGLLEAIDWIVVRTIKLGELATNKPYNISSLTIFSHYTEEFEQLKNILLEMGTEVAENNGPFVRLTEPHKIEHNNIDTIRIRKPDPYRMQVGCVDFRVENYEEFKSEYLIDGVENLRLIQRADYEMIEFFDPDFDVLAYVVSKPLIE